ncbi:hypothetical protein J1N35_011129 [Gossypium stocksii]|uniref:Uncharacterized protein n=1 Tax=Gossypium stocksii TaxID=47602 RepID=A0A9D3W1N1_9ROSI|nr:hypothetical protein J1N35_011129 [Gossypium stocksii]
MLRLHHAPSLRTWIFLCFLTELVTKRKLLFSIKRLDTRVINLKGKYKDAQIEYEQYNEKVNHLKDEKSVLEEKLKAHKESHKAELEILRQSHEETFRKFQKDTQKNLIEALLECRSNLILHAQVVACSLDFIKVDFNCLKDIPIELLNFDVYYPKGEKWETFLRDLNQAYEYIIPPMPVAEEIDEGSVSKGQNPEDPFPTEGVSTAPTNQTNEGRD